MKNFTFIALALFFICSCNLDGDLVSGNGNPMEETRNVGKFHSVKSSGSIDVVISIGELHSVSIKDDENLLPYIITEVKNGILNIYYKNGFSIQNSNAIAYITAPTLNDISGSGSSDIKVEGVLENKEKIEFSLSGSGSIAATVDAPVIKASISGSGDINLDGKTQKFQCKISGSGDANCGELRSEHCIITVSGSANATVFASVELDATVSGSGDILYRGNPANADINKSGSGSVQPKQ